MKKTNVINFSFLFIIAFIILGISACKKNDTPEDDSKSLVLGVLLPLDQEKGLLRENALRLAIDEINNAGGLGNNHNIELIVMSSEGADRQLVAAAAAQEIISQNDNVVGFISSFSSSTTGIVENVSIPHHYPCIAGSATSKSLTGISTYFHRLCPPDDFEAIVLSDRTNFYGINSVAIAVEDGDTYSEDLASSFQNAFGIGVSPVVNFNIDDLDYMSKIDQLLADNPESIFISMLNPSAYIKFFDMLEPLNTTFILSDGLFSNDFFQADIEQIVGEINWHTKNFGAFPSADTTDSSYIYFETALWEKYEQEVASYNAQFYDIGYIYAMAIEKTLSELGTADMQAFREKVNDNIRLVSNVNTGDTEVNPSQGWQSIKETCQLGGVDYSGASGNCNIDNEGNAITAYSIFKVIKSGDDYAFEIIEIIP
ncbi:MAG: ABC transporter substrate-binding protein [Bacteroidales bacterium]|nr:ABC transporter substrate-binding protein [Bacteroidales bacterium]